jgi:predicted ATPase
MTVSIGQVLLEGHALLEREDELTALAGLLDASDGDGRLGVIAGEPGIGKTALLAAARELASERGLQTLGARASELEQGLAFGLVRQLVEPVLIGCAAAEREELFAGAAALARPLFEPDTASTPGAGPDPDFGVLHGLYWLVASLARRGRLLLALDDVQWSDAASLRFLHFLLRRVEGLPIAIVTALRAGTSGAAAALLDEPGAVVIRPRGLSTSAVERLLGEHVGSADPELARACRRSTGGVPLYVLAALEELALAGGASTGTVRAPIAEHARADVESLGAEVVLRSVTRSLGALAPAAAKLAQALAILGDGVELELAARLAELDIDDAQAAARGLRDSAILALGESPAFAHPVIRAAIYKQVPGDARVAHARAARLLIEAGAGVDDVALQLLRALPGAEPRACELLRAAADSALARGAPEAAVAFLTRLLAETLEPRERVDALLELGVAEARAGHAGAVEHLEQALTGASDAERRTVAALTLARVLFAAGRPRESVDLLHREALALRGDSPERAGELEAELRAFADIDLAVRPYALGLEGASSVRAGVETQAGPDPDRDPIGSDRRTRRSRW